MPKQKWGTNSKQYCAEQEHDQYDQLYRKSDVFYEYLNDAPCKIPKIEEHLADPVELLETIDEIDLPAHRLTGKVRLQYLSYLEKLLDGNYDAWAGTVEPYENVTFTPDEVKRCAASIEMKAVQSCMIMSLYRNYVLQLISQIRKETNECILHPSLINMKFTPKIIKKECCHVSVQTDPIEQINDTQEKAPINLFECNDLPLLDVPAMSLDEKIRNFERKMHLSSPKLKTRRDKREKRPRKERSRSRAGDRLSLPITSHEPEPAPQIHQPKPASETFKSPLVEVPKPENLGSQDDEILRELEAMFDTGDDGNIFDSCENQVQIKAIMNEIEKFEPQTCEQSHTLNVLETSTGQLHRDIPEVPSPKFDYDNSQNCLLVPKEYSKLEPGEEKVTDLRKSLWPCELHMQKTKLREILSNIADNNYLRYERIRARFVILFGEYEDEEDELGPYSPSIELNEILVSSCRQRIAKWVVQALMKPLNDGLIANRFLFKKLAKHVADNIIYLNQYPDQRFIKYYVTDYFCTHPMIASIEDMN
ncbi:uncharacterized protein LOC5577339 isoform X1 [Aedes aegypti]|uniref:Uncharacterized protein n=1 Tax=Aedes aegypti TaxID=7159 RepID=A0A6I8T3M4_AEDAE|nr:uncharacterized protein LOC5577339 isoform X1 [Aedes aegypti]